MKTYIWTLPTRLFHWMLAISFVAAFISGEEDELINLHSSLGLLIGTLVLFRLIQGLAGPRYARFRDFPISPFTILDYLSGRRPRSHFPGHNPLAAMVMMTLVFTALVAALSGLAILIGGENGFLGLRADLPFDAEMAGEVHEVAVHLFLILVGLHLSGLVVDFIVDRPAGTIFSIFTGYKRIQAIPASLSPAQKIFSVTWLAIPVILFVFTMLHQHNSSRIPSESRDTIENIEDDD